MHILIICDSPIHTRIARLLLKIYPKCGVDMVEGEEYLGATGLHLAIAYGNDEVAEMLILACGVSVTQRARGVFFLPKDQQSDKPVINTTYQVSMEREIINLQFSKRALHTWVSTHLLGQPSSATRASTTCYWRKAQTLTPKTHTETQSYTWW